MGICVPEEVHACIPKQTLVSLHEELALLRVKFTNFQKAIEHTWLKGRIDFSRFCHLFAIVKSRVVGINGMVYDEEQIKSVNWIEWGSHYDMAALCPVFDLLNNSLDSNASYYYDQNTNSMVVEMVEDTKADSQVFICYGPKCDDTLFNNYGFVFKADENDENSIKLFHEEIIEELVQQGKAPQAVINEQFDNEENGKRHRLFAQL